MTEPTTIEKIDAMLAWLDEGTSGPVAWKRYDDFARLVEVDQINTPMWKQAIVIDDGSACGEYGGVGERDEMPAKFANIAALLNGVRPALEAAREQVECGPYEWAEGIPDAVEAIIEPLWQAFKEARDA